MENVGKLVKTIGTCCKMWKNNGWMCVRVCFFWSHFLEVSAGFNLSNIGDGNGVIPETTMGGFTVGGFITKDGMSIHKDKEGMVLRHRHPMRVFARRSWGRYSTRVSKHICGIYLI